MIAGPVLLAAHFAYYLVDHATIAGMVVIVALALAAIAAPRAERFAENPTAAVSPARARDWASSCALYVDYGAIRPGRTDSSVSAGDGAAVAVRVRLRSAPS